MNQYDALVIGAGPAGSTLARQLARKNWCVLLIDREAEGRDRVCGGFLGSEVQTLWPLLGLAEEAKNLPGTAVQTLLLSSPGTRCIETALPGAHGTAVHRADFDRWLCDQAVAAGAVFRAKTSALAIRRSGDSWEAKIAGNKGPEQVSIRAVIRTHGRRQTTAPLSGRSGIFFGCKTVYENCRGLDGRVALHFARNAHVGFDSLGNGRATMCLYTDHARMDAAGGDLDKMMTGLATENPHIGEHLRFAKRAAGWTGCQAQPDNREIFYEDGAFRAGDAVTMVNPIIGGGIPIAMGSAVLLAQLLMEGFAAKSSENAIAAEYARQWKRQFRKRLRYGRWLGRCERSSLATNLLLRLAGAHSAVRDRLVRYSRPALAV